MEITFEKKNNSQLKFRSNYLIFHISLFYLIFLSSNNLFVYFIDVYEISEIYVYRHVLVKKWMMSTDNPLEKLQKKNDSLLQIIMTLTNIWFQHIWWDKYLVIILLILNPATLRNHSIKLDNKVTICLLLFFVSFLWR